MQKQAKSGWKQVYEGSGAHLDRVLEIYKELGYETKLEPLSPQEMQKRVECASCYEADEVVYKLYIKEKE